MTKFRMATTVAVVLVMSACGSGDDGGANSDSLPVAKNAAIQSTRPPATTRPPAVTRPPATTKAPAATNAPATTRPPVTTNAPATTRPPVTIPLAPNGCRSTTEVVLIAVGTTDRYCFTMATAMNTILFGGRACTATETGLYSEGTPPTTQYCISTASLGSFRAPSS